MARDRSQHRIFRAERIGDGFAFGDDISKLIDSVTLYGVAYVIPSHHWIDESDCIPDSERKPIVQNGNIELGRDFYRVERNGRCDWVDSIYKKECIDHDIPPVFKKRGWAYEREIRLVLTLKEPIDCERIGIAFDGPLENLKSSLETFASPSRETALWGGKRTTTIKLADPRFPLVQQGPWYKSDPSRPKICGLSLDDALPSEYVDEINVFTEKKGE